MPLLHREGLKNLLQNLEVLLQSSAYFAGDELTIADFGFLANVATIKVKFIPQFTFEFFKISYFQALGADLSEYPKLNAWYERCSNLPGASDNERGSKLIAERVKSLLDEPTWI